MSNNKCIKIQDRFYDRDSKLSRKHFEYIGKALGEIDTMTCGIQYSFMQNVPLRNGYVGTWGWGHTRSECCTTGGWMPERNKGAWGLGVARGYINACWGYRYRENDHTVPDDEAKAQLINETRYYDQSYLDPTTCPPDTAAYCYGNDEYNQLWGQFMGEIVENEEGQNWGTLNQESYGCIIRRSVEDLEARIETGSQHFLIEEFKRLKEWNVEILEARAVIVVPTLTWIHMKRRPDFYEEATPVALAFGIVGIKKDGTWDWLSGCDTYSQGTPIGPGSEIVVDFTNVTKAIYDNYLGNYVRFALMEMPYPLPYMTFPPFLSGKQILHGVRLMCYHYDTEEIIGPGACDYLVSRINEESVYLAGEGLPRINDLKIKFKFPGHAFDNFDVNRGNIPSAH